MYSKLHSAEMTGSGLWIDEANADAFANACHREIAIWLTALAGESTCAENLSVDVSPPTKRVAQRAFDSNTTLNGEIDFRWFDESIRLTVPMPFHGAFLFRRQRSRHPLVTVWPSWLAEARGFRLLRPTSERKRRDASYKEWRIGFPDGKWIGAPLSPTKELSAQAKRALARKHLTYIGNPQEFDEWMRASLGLLGPRGTGKKAQSPAKAWRSVHELIVEHYADDQNPPTSDEDDLDHRILVTFPVWLKNRISRECLDAVLFRGADRARALAVEVLRGEAEGGPELAAHARVAVRDSLKSLGPKITWAINSHRSEEKTDFVDPINPLDLASRITRVRRIHLPASRLKEMPGAYRQNHPSFRGRICPVDSPESEQVGLTLQLSAGGKVDFTGKIQPAEAAAAQLGFGAGLIPFFAHNDGARNMMGAKNLRQAVPVREAQPPKVRTGGERAVAEFTKPLVEIGLCLGASADKGEFFAGRDLLIAYLPWKGMNFEDAIVLGQHVADEGLLDCIGLRKTVRVPMPVGWAPEEPRKQSKTRGLGKDGLVAAGTKVSVGDAIACFGWEGKRRSKQRLVFYRERTPAFVKNIKFLRKQEWMAGILEYELELPIPIRPGDKLMGRHGNKGVVGTILPITEMPRLPDSGDLPEHLRGRPIDLLLNPHGVISRMNIGQLIETHVGWLLHGGTCTESDLLRTGIAAEAVAAPFADALDHRRIQDRLEKTGLDKYGRIHLRLPNGGQTLSPVIVGFQHIVRLRHIPELKSQARRGGKDALYAARTGQAIHGRNYGGGQRLGEMEVWALAAHQADAILAEMIGAKSSAEIVSQIDGVKPISPDFTGFSQVLKDWLFALGIDLQISETEVKLLFLNDQKLLGRIGADNRVTTSAGQDSYVAASFRCPQGKKHPCEFRLLDGDEIGFKASKKDEQATLSLGELLEHLEFRADGPLRKTATGYELALRNLFTNEPAEKLQFIFEGDGDALKATARFVSIGSAEAPPTVEQLATLKQSISTPAWTKQKPLPEIHVYGRFGKQQGVNWSARELLQQFQRDGSRKRNKLDKTRTRSVLEMQVTCARHRGEHGKLRATEPFRELPRSAPGGLFDRRIFGSATSVAGGSLGKWGYVELPVPVRYPIHIFLTRSHSPRNQIRAVTKFLKTNGMAGEAIPTLARIPVLPIRYRLPARSNGVLVRDEIERQGYAPLLDACRRYSEAADRKKRSEYAKEISRQVETLYRRLVNPLREKSGLIRYDGLGRRVDRSARLVVTPNPRLGWDEAGIPTAVLLELMGDLVSEWLNQRTADVARHNPLPKLEEGLWLHPAKGAQAIADARAVLEAYFKAHPNFVVLLNRQPSLHRDSFQAFHPVPLPQSAGDVIQLCPLTCKGFAADFDGDEMVVHIPVCEMAQTEARRLLPSNNLFSLATESDAAENILAHFDQDFVMGNWFLGKSDEVGLHQCFLDMLPGDCCRNLVAKWDHPRKSEGAELLTHVASEHPSDAAKTIASWMEITFRACSLAGVSFGYYEIRELAERMAKEVSKICAEEIGASDRNKLLEKLTEKVLEEIVRKARKETASDPTMSFAAIALSGARGKKQVRQIIAARGVLEPGSVGFSIEENCRTSSSRRDDVGRKCFFIRGNLATGLTRDEMFWGAMNARSSMCDKKLGVGYAGGLTRTLVFALEPYRIVSKDCGCSLRDRNPVTCKRKDGVCAKCYGVLPKGEYAPVGFPIGLIAAQSIGERGTQLSFQSFHASERKINIHTVRDYLGIGATVENPEFSFSRSNEAHRFVSKMREADAYKRILPRHFQVLWKALSRSKDRTLISAIEEHDSLTRWAYHDTTPLILQSAMQVRSSARNTLFGKVLLGGFTGGT